MTLSWDPDDERVVIEVFPFTEAAVVSRAGRGDFAEPEPEELLLVRIPAGAARAFCSRARRWSRPAVPAARSAATRSTRTGTSACGPTGSAAATREHRDAASARRLDASPGRADRCTAG